MDKRKKGQKVKQWLTKYYRKLKTKNGVGWNLGTPEVLVVTAPLVATFALCYSC